jgi:hypothetical protein
MNSFIKEKLTILLFLFSTCAFTFGQGFSPYYSNPTYQKYLSYLIYSGKLKVSHPLSQPYSVGELSDSLKEKSSSFSHLSTIEGAQSKQYRSQKTISGKTEQMHLPDYWLALLEKDLRLRFNIPDQQDSLKGNMNIGLEAGNRNKYQYNTYDNDFYGSGFASFSFRNIGLYSGITVDEEYKRDTMYFGTTGKLENKVISRSNESYLQWANKNFILFAGRINRNFGLTGTKSMILSDESFSFDHIAFTFRNKILKYTSLFGRLNDIYGFDIRDSVTAFQWNKRFLNIHRFEVSLSKKVEVAFTDVILFGGKDAFPQFQYLNPVNFLFMSKMSDRKGYEETNANALMCFDLYYKPSDNLTLFGQFLIDDVDFKKSLRAVYPDRLGYSAKVIYTDLLPASQLCLSYNRISNWTYNSFYTWGNYTYYGKSIGYPRNGSENIILGFDSYKFYPFMLGLEILAEQYRIQDMSAPFIAVKTKFPSGTPQKSLSLKFNTTFIPNSLISANLTTEFATYDNFGFIKSERQSFFNIFLTLKLQGIFSLF